MIQKQNDHEQIRERNLISL